MTPQSKAQSHAARRIRLHSPIQPFTGREQSRVHCPPVCFVEKACELGWAKEQVIVIDEDLGLSGSGSASVPGLLA